MVALVAEFVDERVRPRVREFEEADVYPAEYGGVDVSTACFARVTEELARGWMSLAGAIGGHSVITYLIKTFGANVIAAQLIARNKI
jgi:alkylation response protein AidB-like acyl-CoA dehydrogenase